MNSALPSTQRTIPGSAAPAGEHRREHALRQPLNALGLLCEALRMQGLSPAQGPVVDAMSEAVASLERQLDDLFRELQSALEGSAPSGAMHSSAAVTAPAPVSAASAGSARRQSAGSMGAAPSALGRRVVVVDDDDAARIGLVLLLEAWGAEVSAFASVAALRDWLAPRRVACPDLAILDYHLPRPGEGLEALRLMRAHWPGRTLRALLITGDDRAALSNALSDGSLEFLIKPVMPQPLMEAMQRHWTRL